MILWHFSRDGSAISMVATYEADGVVGDRRRHIGPGEDTGIEGLTFEMLDAAAGGIVEEADDGTFTLTPAA